MHSTLAIALALAASGQQPDSLPFEAIPSPPGYRAEAAHSPAVPGHGSLLAPPVRSFAYPTGHMYPDVAPQGIYGPQRCNGWMYPNGICGHKHVQDPFSWLNWWSPPGNMLMYYSYFPAEHGYYYFKPYNVTRVSIQQKFAASFGGDPRHPYTNQVFERVYRDYARRRPPVVDEEILPPEPPGTVDEFGLEPALQ